MNFCRSKHFFNYSTILLLIILFEEILAVDDICISGTSKVTNDLLHEGMNVSKEKFSLNIFNIFFALRF